MNEHPRIGAEILGRSRIPLFQLAAEVALSHHERFDGRAYPQGLAGEEIAPSGRIVAVVDCFIAHASELIQLRDNINRKQLDLDDLTADTVMLAALRTV